MTDIEKKLAQLRKAHEAGNLDEETYRFMLDALGVETAGDNIDLSAGSDVAFAKDSGKATVVRDSRAGVIGDKAAVSGGIHFDESMDAKFKKRADQIQGAVQAEKIDNLVLRYNDKKSWITALWDILKNRQDAYRKNLDEINGIVLGDPLETARYYVEPDCQDLSPSEHYAEQSFESKEPVMGKINGFFQAPSFHTGDNCLFILSDAGMGKTALLTMLKLMDLTALWPKQKKCTLKKLGKGTLKEIGNLENRAGTILLLDSLDEDPEAYGRVRDRMLDILRATKAFYKVIITCRTQFFPDGGKDPFRRPGFFKIAEFTCHAKHLSFFSDENVRKYLAKRFPKKFIFWEDRKKMDAAQAVIEKMGSLRCRPMLLSFIEDLMDSPAVSDDGGEYHVYDALVKSWLLREKSKNKELSEDSLLNACIILATVMQTDGKRRTISEQSLDRLIDKIKDVLPVKKIDVKGRSLINRNAEGDYRFSHYSIQEFCVAKLLLEKPVFRPKKKIPVTDFIFRQIASASKTPNFIDQIDFKGLTFGASAQKDLRGLELPGVDLSGVNLSGADLSGSNLCSADLSGANLKCADFSDCRLDGCCFRNADLRETNFEGADYWKADFENAELEYLPSLKNSFGMEFVYIPPGTFMMGSPPDESGRYDRETLHEVTISTGFFMQTTPVTQKQWTAVMGNNPSHFKMFGGSRPVETVSWEEVQKFIEILNKAEEKQCRLPTEAEWEYACRAGTQTRYYTGDTDAELERAGWYKKNSGGKTHPVGEKEPNAFGLYDMHGNVWEWCRDWYGDYPTGAVTDPVGPESGSIRVIRGGSWHDSSGGCRAAFRSHRPPGNRFFNLGFRLVLPGQLAKFGQPEKQANK